MRSFLGSRLIWMLTLVLAACQQVDPHRLVVSGRVEVDNIHIGSKIGGRVWRVHYDEGDAVEAGTPVVELEATELNAQLAEARAAVSQASAALDLLLAGTRREDLARAEAVVRARRAELEMRRKGFRAEEVKGAEAEVASAQSALQLARREYERAKALYDRGNLDQQQLDTRQVAVETAQAQLAIAEQRLALFRSGSRPEEVTMAEAQLTQAEADLERLRNGARPEEIAAARAGVEAALANVARIEAQLAETRILAPVQAIVETLDLEPGDLVKAGETVAVLNLRNAPWVRCYVPENRLGWVRPGLEVQVTVDSLPGQMLRGTIRRVSAEAEFTPRNVQTTEKRAELVFEMKVDILDNVESLRAGMYADVHIARTAS